MRQIDATDTLDRHWVAEVLHALERADQTLVRARQPTDETRSALAHAIALADEARARHAFEGTDPYLVLAFMGGLISSMHALEEGGRAGRRAMRIALEQIRQALRDMAQDDLVSDHRDPNAVAQWLLDVLDARQSDLAGLLGVGARTLQRWVSATDATRPEGDDAMRVRIVARLVNHLRHALTGPGVLQWFDRPHPELGGRPPAALLDDATSFPQLQRIAAATRSSRAS